MKDFMNQVQSTTIHKQRAIAKGEGNMVREMSVAKMKLAIKEERQKMIDFNICPECGGDLVTKGIFKKKKICSIHGVV